MKKHLSLGLLSVLIGCNLVPHPRKEKTVSYLEQLSDTYRSLQTAEWTDTDACDALMFNSLRATAGISINISEAADSDHPGRWYRRPTSLPECYSTGESRSTISRDMLLGLYWYLWQTQNAQSVADLWAYGSSRSWFMGDGLDGGADTVLNPNMISLLARLCTKLNASCNGTAAWKDIPLTYTGDAEGYTRHLEVLQILLLGEMDGSIPGYLADRLAKHANEQTQNPLFAAAMVIYNGWNEVEVDNRLQSWPSDRLPNSSDWCSRWRVESEGPGSILPDGSSGWNPCADNLTHSGGEILFIKRVVSGKN